MRYFLKRVFENVTKPTSVNNIYNELKSQGMKVSKECDFVVRRGGEIVELVQVCWELAPENRTRILVECYRSFDSVFSLNLAMSMMKRSCRPSPIRPFSS